MRHRVARGHARSRVARTDVVDVDVDASIDATGATRLRKQKKSREKNDTKTTTRGDVTPRQDDRIARVRGRRRVASRATTSHAVRAMDDAMGISWRRPRDGSQRDDARAWVMIAMTIAMTIAMMTIEGSGTDARARRARRRRDRGARSSGRHVTRASAGEKVRRARVGGGRGGRRATRGTGRRATRGTGRRAVVVRGD